MIDNDSNKSLENIAKSIGFNIDRSDVSLAYRAGFFDAISDHYPHEMPSQDLEIIIEKKADEYYIGLIEEELHNYLLVVKAISKRLQNE